MMKWLWRKIWGGCDHKWKKVKEVKVWNVSFRTGEVEKDMPIGSDYILECEKCGWVKSVRV